MYKKVYCKKKDYVKKNLDMLVLKESNLYFLDHFIVIVRVYVDRVLLLAPA